MTRMASQLFPPWPEVTPVTVYPMGATTLAWAIE